MRLNANYIFKLSQQSRKKDQVKQLLQKKVKNLEKKQVFLSGSGILAQRGTGHVCDHMTIALATVVTTVAKELRKS